MRKILWLIILIPGLVSGQGKYEIQEFTGVIRMIGHRATGLAYEVIEIDVAGKEESFLFRPYYGKTFVENFKIGDPITVRVNINVTVRERLEQQKKNNAFIAMYRDYFARDYIEQVKLKDEWISLPEKKEEIGKMRFRYGKVFLDLPVKDIYKEDGTTVGIIFDNGLAGNVGFARYMKRVAEEIKKIKVRDIVSFVGYRASGDESAYPAPGVRVVYGFTQLTKNQGIIKSLLYKQNFVCIGLVLKTKDEEEVSVSFPSDYASRVNKFAKSGKEVVIYNNDYKIESQINHPELHAIVSGSDTLRIDDLWFYGGADVRHEHTPATVSGRIGKIDRGVNNRIISFIVDNDVYVDVNAGNMEQIAKYIKKGVEVEVAGDERIKKEGEIYLKEYRILIPHRIKIDGKEFLLP